MWMGEVVRDSQLLRQVQTFHSSNLLGQEEGGSRDVVGIGGVEDSNPSGSLRTESRSTIGSCQSRTVHAYQYGRVSQHTERQTDRQTDKQTDRQKVLFYIIQIS